MDAKGGKGLVPALVQHLCQGGWSWQLCRWDGGKALNTQDGGCRMYPRTRPVSRRRWDRPRHAISDHRNRSDIEPKIDLLVEGPPVNISKLTISVLIDI